MNAPTKYVHAMGHRALTPFYDPFVRLIMRERKLRKRIIEQLSLRPGSRVLDVGCGTGTLAVWTKRHYPQAFVTGIDGDAEIVALARRKADAAGVEVKFEAALATDLPFDDGSFDCVANTFVMHHLPPSAKIACFTESFRVLRPGGRMHVVDFGPARSNLGRAAMELLRGMAWLADNLDGRLPLMLSGAGFVDVREVGRVGTAFGPAVFLSAARPRS